jgi:uncharacterized membrane protein YdbT with pleckstrin-like domain
MATDNAKQPDKKVAGVPNLGPVAPMEPERELWQSRTSAKAALHLWILGVLFLLTALFIAFAKIEAGTFRTIVAVIAFLPLVTIAWSVMMSKLTTHYRLTTQRLFVTTGILSRTISEVELVRIDDVAVRQNILQRLCGVGDVLLTTTDRSGSDIEILGIDAPVELKEKVRGRVIQLRARVVRMESV